MPAREFPCPYCPRRFARRSTWRVHIIANGCGNVPEEVSVSIIVTDADDLKEDDEFLPAVVSFAERTGWRVYHPDKAKVRPGKHITPGSRGFPDLVLVKPPRLVFLELKAQRGTRRPEQIEWMLDLQRVTEVQAFFAKPSEFEEVHNLLTQEPNPGSQQR